MRALFETPRAGCVVLRLGLLCVLLCWPGETLVKLPMRRPVDLRGRLIGKSARKSTSGQLLEASERGTLQNLEHHWRSGLYWLAAALVALLLPLAAAADEGRRFFSIGDLHGDYQSTMKLG